MLLCDQAITDAESGKKSLIGLYDVLRPSSFPFDQLFTIFAKFTDAEGLYRFRMEYVSVTENRKLLDVETDPLQIPSRLEPFELVARLAVQVPVQGRYEFRLFANDAYVSSVTFDARHRDQETGRHHE